MKFPDRPTLFVELVDRRDPQQAESLRRVPVCVRVDTDPDFAVVVNGRDGFKVQGGDVDGGHHLDVGDVIVAYDWGQPENAWLAMVVEAVGITAERYYKIVTGEPTTRAQWVTWSGESSRWGADRTTNATQPEN